MSFKSRLAAMLAAIAVAAAFGGCAVGTSESDVNGDQTDKTGEQTGGTVTIPDETAESKFTVDAEAVLGGTEGAEAVPDGATEITGKITITEAGDYYVSTVISGKKITVESEGVTLYLSGATLSNEKKVIESVCSLTLTLIGENSVTNSNADGSNAIDCEGDLVINGGGSLAVYSTKNGIKAKSVTVIGATLDVVSGKDGLHAEVDEYDDATAQPVPSYEDGGFVYLSGANVKITSADDGIQADTFVYIADESVVDITAGGGSPETVNAVVSSEASGKGIKAGAIDWAADSLDLDWDNYLICIKSGLITVDSNDDSIHSDGDVEISGGTVALKTGDDAIHADNNVYISGGNITIEKCYEGVEGTNVAVSGGTLTIDAVDDGINAGGGADASGFGGMDGGSGDNGVVSDGGESLIFVSGGKIEIVSASDGLDSNGSIIVSGGEIYISGPTNASDAAIDYDKSAVVTGGIVVAVCRYGMAKTFGDSSTQGSIFLYTASANASGGVTVKDGSGKTLASYEPVKGYSAVVISCPELKTGSEYSVSVCGKTVSVTMTSVATKQSF